MRRVFLMMVIFLLAYLSYHLYIDYRYRPRLQPKGMVLGLYAGEPDYDYHPELNRIASTGATAVSLQAIYRMEEFDSADVVRHPTSSPTATSLRRTFRQAKNLGLKRMFFPTINLRREASSDQWWRGNIAPQDWPTWWARYKAFNVTLARLAQEEGVEWYSLGTEMASTHAFPDEWRKLAAAVRQVYKGKLTYSVNFDSHDTFTFGDCLDVIGVNTYDPIAKHEATPSEEAIKEAWWWILYKARTLEARFNRPVMVTEIGYPSVAGAHKGPWDFRTEKPVDLLLQKRLVSGALDVLRHWQEGEAVFYYLYGENLKQGQLPGGTDDRTYAPWGKPLEGVLRDYFQQPVFWTPLAQQQQHIQLALGDMLAAALRKERDYEDGALPSWVKEWFVTHPVDAKRAKDIIAKEPIPLKKIPKGAER